MKDYEEKKINKLNESEELKKVLEMNFDVIGMKDKALKKSLDGSK